jgi:hypothetical protein
MSEHALPSRLLLVSWNRLSHPDSSLEGKPLSSTPKSAQIRAGLNSLQNGRALGSVAGSPDRFRPHPHRSDAGSPTLAGTMPGTGLAPIRI